jgi:hypothetical protein
MSNLKQQGVATHSYTADFQDKIYSFTVTPENANRTLLDPIARASAAGQDDIGTAAAQAVDIMRRRAGDEDVTPNGLVGAWIPHIYYTHLVLQDYLASRLPEKMVVCPEDGFRENWQIEPVAKFDQGFWLPLQPNPDPIARRWPYSASYQTEPASYDRFQSDLSDSAIGRRIQQGGVHNTYVVPGTVRVGDLRLDNVAYTASKVHMQDSHQRHFGNERPYYGLEQCRQPLLFFDGSVSIHRTGDGNPGWRPNTPTVPCMTYNYQPGPYEYPTISGGPTDFVKGYYRWTRGGLKGVDFGGKPLDTGQPEIGVCDL